MTPTPSPDTLTTLREKVEQWLDKAEDLSGGEQTERRLCALELKAGRHLLSSIIALAHGHNGVQ